MKTIEQERGKLLAERLEILNKFLLSKTDKPFGAYISQYGLTSDSFIKPLPEDYQFKDIGNKTLQDKETLTEYTEELNALYFEQYLGHTEKVEQASADGEYDDAAGDWEDADAWEEAKGKRKAIRKEKKEARKAKKNEVKQARKDKKEKKKQLKNDYKSGKISKSDYKKGKKNARKEMKAKVGSKVGRALGKLNKFNPGTVLIRNAYNSLLLINFRNQAYNLGKMKDEGGEAWKKVLKFWDRMGGDPVALKNNIEKARGKKAFLGGKSVSADGLEDAPNVEYYNVVTAAAVAGWTAAASGAIVAIGAFIKTFKKDKGEPESPEETTDDLPVPSDDPAKEAEEAAKDDKDEKGGGDEEGGGGDEEGGGSFFSEYKLPIFIGGGIAAAITITLIVRAIVKAKGKK